MADYSIDVNNSGAVDADSDVHVDGLDDIKVETTLRGGTALTSASEVAVDSCVRVELAPVAPTMVRSPWEQHVGFSTWGIELTAVSWCGEATTYVEPVPPRPLVVGVPREGSVVLTGAPTRMRGWLHVTNTGVRRASVRGFEVRAHDLPGQPAPGRLQVRLPPATDTDATAALALAPGTPPGEYHATLVVGGHEILAILHVGADPRLELTPSRFIAAGPRAGPDAVLLIPGPVTLEPGEVLVVEAETEVDGDLDGERRHQDLVPVGPAPFDWSSAPRPGRWSRHRSAHPAGSGSPQHPGGTMRDAEHPHKIVRGRTGGLTALRELVDQSLAAWEPAFAAMDWSHWARCRDCADCRSCAGAGTSARGADVLVVATVGERRVVPMTVRNPRPRTTTVTLTPGAWTSCSENPPQITVTVVPGGELVLAPCETREVQLVITVGRLGSAEEITEDGYLEDVHCTAVVVSDLALVGCGQTVRLAVEVVPRDCGAFAVTCCDCGC